MRTERRPISRRDLELHLSFEQERMRVEAEVLHLQDDGFAVAFHALHPDDLIRLRTWLEPEAQPRASNQAELDPGQEQTMENLQLSGWSPPLSEPSLHQWQPSAELTRPGAAEGDFEVSSWHNLATISPSVAPPKPSQTPRQKAPPKTSAHESSESTETAETRGVEQRTEPREEKAIPVSFDDMTGLIKEFTHNISFGGLFTYTRKPFQVKDEVAVTLIHPVHQERLTLLATVMHSSSAPSPDPINGQARYGVGLQFRLPIEELKRLLSDFISSHRTDPAQAPDSELLVEARQVLARAEHGHRALLGLNGESSVDQVRQAYFALVDRFHPDRYFGKVSDNTRKVLEELFRNLTQAYEALCS